MKISFQVNRLIVLFIMSILAALSRVLFIILPSVKPLAGIVYITAMCFNPFESFFVGAFSIFLSNIVFGQGTWTIWQMLAFGLFGFVSSFLKSHNMIKRNIINMSIWASVLSFVVTGLILDICAFTLSPNLVNASDLLSILVSGVPMNLVMAGTTFLTVMLLGKFIIEKLERYKRVFKS